MKRTPLRRKTPLKPRAEKSEAEIEAGIAARIVAAGRARRNGRVCCERCFRPAEVDYHHLWTRGRGGPDTDWNLAALCRICHGAVTDHVCDDWGAWLASCEAEARAIRERLDARERLP